VLEERRTPAWRVAQAAVCGVLAGPELGTQGPDKVPAVEYRAVILQLPAGPDVLTEPLPVFKPDGLSPLNENLQKWAAAGWALHSHTLSVGRDLGGTVQFVVMVVYERDLPDGDASRTTEGQ